MTKPKRVPGEKPLFWVGSSKEELLAFPDSVKDEIGTISFRLADPSPNQFYVLLPGPYTTWRLLLERVKNINRPLKPHGVDGAIRIAAVVLHDFKNAWPFSPPRLRAWVLASELGHAQI